MTVPLNGSGIGSVRRRLRTDYSANRYLNMFEWKCGEETRDDALVARAGYTWSSITSFRCQRAAVTLREMSNCSVNPATDQKVTAFNESERGSKPDRVKLREH